MANKNGIGSVATDESGKRKERIIIDVYSDEASYTFYRLIKAGIVGNIMPDACTNSGYFMHEDDLNEWLEDFKDVIEVVTDHRRGE